MHKYQLLDRNKMKVIMLPIMTMKIMAKKVKNQNFRKSSWLLKNKSKSYLNLRCNNLFKNNEFLV